MPKDFRKPLSSLRNKIKRLVSRLDILSTLSVQASYNIEDDTEDGEEITHFNENNVLSLSTLQEKTAENSTSNYLHNVHMGMLHKSGRRSKNDKRLSTNDDINLEENVVIVTNDSIAPPRLTFLRRNEAYFRRKARCSSKHIGPVPPVDASTDIVEDIPNVKNRFSVYCDSKQYNSVAFNSSKPERFSLISDTNYDEQLISSSDIRCLGNSVSLPTVDRVRSLNDASDACTKLDLLIRYFDSLPNHEELEKPSNEMPIEFRSVERDASWCKTSERRDYVDVLSISLSTLAKNSNEMYEKCFEDCLERRSSKCGSVADSGFEKSTKSWIVHRKKSDISKFNHNYTENIATDSHNTTATQLVSCNNYCKGDIYRKNVCLDLNLPGGGKGKSIGSDDRPETGYHSQETSPGEMSDLLRFNISRIETLLTNLQTAELHRQ